MNAKIIDWKELSKSEGYKKLKASWYKDRESSDKHRFDNKWKWIFNLLKKICFKHNLKPCEVLDVWEKDRNSWYPNYYQEYNSRKLEKLALTTTG